MYVDWSQLSHDLQRELTLISQPVSERSRVLSSVLHETILAMCQGRYLGRRVLAQLLNRNPDDLLKRTLKPLVQQRRLKTAYPYSSDPRQAYTAQQKE